MASSRRLWALTGVVGVALALYLSGESVAQTEGDEVVDGAQLFADSCSSCHGEDGGGTDNGPSLIDAGEASVHFQLTTGRMPLADPNGQTTRKDPAFDDAQIEALVDHVGNFGRGPDIPDVELEGADLSIGQTLFIENCAACHGATGAGGAVGNQAFAPSLSAATPTEIAEAMIVGPGQMPRFELSDEQRNDVVNFIVYLRDEPRPGGADIGGIGPVPEGFVAWIAGMGALLIVAFLIGKSKRGPESGEGSS
ncbi:MAG: cytochrome bc1 complex diheme cytochrome c subunit [Actinomycetota bacterium]